MNRVILFFFFLFSFSACYFGGGLSVRYNFPSVGEGSAPSDSEYFYIDLDIDKYEAAGDLVPYYEISTTEEYGDAAERDSLSNCEIYYKPQEEGELEERESSEEPLICILDLLEYEFLLKDIEIVYNFPEGMCDAVETSLPWHFNAEIIPGPRVVKKTTPAQPAGCTDDPEVDCTTEEKEILCDATTDRCLSENEEEDDLCPPSGTWRKEGSEPIKCCYGGDRSDNSSWLPDIRCFGGPALIAEMENYSKENFRITNIYEAPKGGLNGNIKLPKFEANNLGLGFKLASETRGYTGVSSPVTNYLKALDRSPEKLKNVRRSSLPDFLQDSSIYPYRPRLFFEFSCKDSAGEILHKILLMIREWNTYEEFKKFYTAGGDDSADPDVEGKEGEDCQYEDFSTLDGEIEECNDYLDLDDITNCKGYPWCTYFNRDRKIYPRISYPGGEASDADSSGSGSN